MNNSDSGYGLRALALKFWAQPRYMKWQFTWSILRGILRLHQIDSRYLVLMGAGVKIAKRQGRIITNGVCIVRPGCRIAVVGKKEQPAYLHIGVGTDIGDRTIINVSQCVKIGARCSISWDCDINDSDFHQVIMADGQRPPIIKSIAIEDDVWIGSHSLILKGVTIGHHSVVAAGSVVHHDMPPYSLVAGNPARRIGQISDWQR